MKRNDLNAIITGIVHRYIEDGWVLEMTNASYSDVVGVHFLSRGRERVAIGIRQPELERLLHFDFDAINELGDHVTLTLTME